MSKGDKDQALYNRIGRELKRAAEVATAIRAVRKHPCGHSCDCRDNECPCSTPGVCQGEVRP